MSNEVFLSLETEQSLLFGQRIVFAISSLLNIVGLFCLIKKTPPHQAEIKSYLLVIQATVIATDVFFSVLYEPFPVFQVFAGYCVGILCAYLQSQTVTAIYTTLTTAMAASILICVIHRHQTIVQRGQFILSQRNRSVLNWFIYGIYCIPCIVFAGYPTDLENSENLIETSSVDVKWIRDRGQYFMQERNFIALSFITVMVMAMLLCIAIPSIVFVHMIVVLNEEKAKSAKLKRSIRISLFKFFIQVGAPILLVIIPFLLLFIEILIHCFSFNVCIFLLSIVPFHPIAHNVILIIIVPEYRSYFASLIVPSFFKGGYPKSDSQPALKIVTI